ncbi:hypothetical protein OHS81_37300 [Streptomyces sp. NBC_00400]|uniref:hypothetical protein n=1 Tax=Streptomyces sp. NBC_00400 TaxID=2975737 RepID=UPI002E1D6369
MRGGRRPPLTLCPSRLPGSRDEFADHAALDIACAHANSAGDELGTAAGALLAAA